MPGLPSMSRTGNQAGRHCTGASTSGTYASRSSSCRRELSWTAAEISPTTSAARNTAPAPAPSPSPCPENPAARRAPAGASRMASGTTKVKARWTSCPSSCAPISRARERAGSGAMFSASGRLTLPWGTTPSGGRTCCRPGGWRPWPIFT